jgi:hypothetical protein
MASLNDISKTPPSLAQIANKIKNTAVKLAPKRTGNLKRQLDTYNRPSGMIKRTLQGGVISYSFEIDVAPPGAEYGKWWNDPNVSRTVKNGKTKNIPGSINFAQKAIESPEVLKMIDMLVNDTANEVADMINKELSDI